MKKTIIAVILTAAIAISTIAGLVSCGPKTENTDTVTETDIIVTDTDADTEIEPVTDTQATTDTDSDTDSAPYPSTSESESDGDTTEAETDKETDSESEGSSSESTSETTPSELDTTSEGETSETNSETDSETETETETSTEFSHSHTFSAWKTVKEATCESKGSKERVCSGCGEKETEEVAATGHEYGNWKTVKEASCKEEGKRERECGRCGKKETERISKTSHQWGDWYETKAATTTENGLKERSCKVCGKVEQETIEKLAGACAYHPYPAGDWSHTTYLGKTEATCTDGERHKYKCNSCGTEFLSDYGPGGVYDGGNLKGSLGHDWEEWIVTKEPTSTQDGEMTKTCSRCGKTEKNKVDKTGEAVWGYTVGNFNDGSCVEYYVKFEGERRAHYSVLDYRSWGSAPVIKRTGENEVSVSWRNKTGETLTEKLSGYDPNKHLSCLLYLLDDGSYYWEYVVIGY